MFSSESKILHHLRSQSTIQSIAILVFKPAVLPGKGRNGDGDGVDRVVGEVVLLWLQATHLLEHLRTKTLLFHAIQSLSVNSLQNCDDLISFI